MVGLKSVLAIVLSVFFVSFPSHFLYRKRILLNVLANQVFNSMDLSKRNSQSA